jgi:hypothetical protein
MARSGRGLEVIRRPRKAFAGNGRVVWEEMSVFGQGEYSIQTVVIPACQWRTFTQRPFPPAGTSGLMLSLAMDSREDFGFMVSRDLADPDGHLWAVFWMNPAATPPVKNESVRAGKCGAWRLAELARVACGEPAQVAETVAQCHLGHRCSGWRRAQLPVHGLQPALSQERHR